jgi:hypothetical protein
VAEVDEFPALSPTFAKILQNFKFMTPRKQEAPPSSASEETPAKQESVF